jgi:hypothetical protein
MQIILVLSHFHPTPPVSCLPPSLDFHPIPPHLFPALVHVIAPTISFFLRNCPCIQLFRDKVAGEHYVRLKFGKGTPGPNMPRHKVETVIVEGCGGGEFCELSRFKRCVGAYVPKDFDKECGL